MKRLLEKTIVCLASIFSLSLAAQAATMELYWSVGGKGCESFELALTNAYTKSKPIVLEKDLTLEDASLSFDAPEGFADQEVVLDLNGHSITSMVVDTFAIMVFSNANVRIVSTEAGGAISQSVVITPGYGLETGIANEGTLVFGNDDDDQGVRVSCGIRNESDGDLTIVRGFFDCEGNTSGSAFAWAENVDENTSELADERKTVEGREYYQVTTSPAFKLRFDGVDFSVTDSVVLKTNGTAVTAYDTLVVRESGTVVTFEYDEKTATCSDYVDGPDAVASNWETTGTHHKFSYTVPDELTEDVICEITVSAKVTGLVGDGSQNSPYQLSSVADLQLWKEDAGKTFASNAYYKVMSDITIDAATAATLLPLFPTSGAKFAGTFDGGNHKITYTLNTTNEWTALFGHSQNATFKNAYVDGTITADGEVKCYCGILLAQAYGHNLFENITTDGSITGSKVKNVAGVCIVSIPVSGEANFMTFNHCTNKADMATTYTKAAGIFCYNNGNSGTAKNLSFTGCCNMGNITCAGASGGAWVGGMVSYLRYVNTVAFTNCSNTGTLSGSQDTCGGGNSHVSVGGLIALFADSSDLSSAATLVDCFNSGTIAGIGKAVGSGAVVGGLGGMIGRLDSTVKNDVVIENCSNTGSIEYGEGSADVSAVIVRGSIVGQNASAVMRDGVVSAQCSMTPIGGIVACPQFSFATVADGVATFCDPEAGGSYKVMLGGQTVTLTNVNDWITLDMSLTNATVATTATGCEIVQSGNTYTVTPKSHAITYVYTTNGVSVAADLLTGLDNSAATSFLETADVTIETNKITLVGYILTKADPCSWNAGDKTADVEVTINFDKEKTLEGSGTSADPYRVGTLADLQLWANGAGTKYANDAFYQLTGDITIDAATAATLLPLFPTSGAKFAGTFDGGNHKITYTLAVTQTYTAFFGHSENASFKNVVIDGTLTSDSVESYCSIFLCQAYGNTLFENITSEGSITGTVIKNVSGICNHDIPLSGNASNYTTFNYCTNKANISTIYTKAAGVLSYNKDKNGNNRIVSFTGCSNEGNITAAGIKGSWVAGMVAWPTHINSLSFTNCSNSGVLTGTQSTVGSVHISMGAMIGMISDASGMTCDINVVGCSNSGSIIAKADAVVLPSKVEVGGIGGLVGRADGTINSKAILIENSSNTGSIGFSNESVDISSCTKVGSLVGNASAVTRTGTVTAQASMVPMGFNCAAYSFATVTNGVATFCDPEAGGSYKVMLGGQTVTLTNVTDSITLDMSLTNATVATTATGCEIVQSGNTYTVTPKSHAITYVYTTNGVSVAADLLTGLDNRAATSFVETADVTIETNKITLAEYNLVSATPYSWNAGDKTADVEVTIAFELAYVPPIPALPDNPTAADVTNAINNITGMSDASKTNLQYAVAGDPARYNAFSGWAAGCSGGQEAAVASAYVVESFLLRPVVAESSNYLFTNEPAVNTTDFVATNAPNFCLTLELKDGDTQVQMSTVKANLASCLFKGTNVTAIETQFTAGEITAAEQGDGVKTVTLKLAPDDFTPKGFIQFIAK